MAGPQQEHLSSEEWENWIPIRRATELISEIAPDPDAARDYLIGRIRSGAIPIAARERVQINERGEFTQRLYLVVTRTGVPWVENADPRFWEIGDHTVRVAVDSTGYSGTRVAVEFHGVRLEPSTLGQLLRELGAPIHASPIPNEPEDVIAKYGYATIRDATNSSSTEIVSYEAAESLSPKPRWATEGDIREWVRQFCTRQPNASFADVRDSARSHFTNLRCSERVVKRVIDKLGFKKDVGNPKWKPNSAQN